MELDLQKLKDAIDFHPHDKQSEVLSKRTRFTTLCWGRRSGKTLLAAYIALVYLITQKEDGKGHNIWIAAPTYDLARRSWDYLVLWAAIVNKKFGQMIKVNKSQYTMECYSGSKLELKSTDNPSSLLGSGLDLLIVDECARVNEDVWRTHLRPTLTDRGGKAVFISTPYGKNWFYDLMLKGTDTDKKLDDYSYFHMKTADNPHIPNVKEEVEKAKIELPANDFMQEYEAEFIEGAGSVFRGVRDCLFETSFRSFPWYDEEFNPDTVYSGGLDLARLEDFTVQTFVKKTDSFRVVGIDRFNELDWKLQQPRLSLMSEKYRNPHINAERNNIGDAVLENLPGNYEAFTTTNATKKDIINNLAILIEQKKIQIPNIPKLVSELEAFSYEVTASGNIKYGAPNGYHDDMVMSLALACKDLREPIGPKVMKSYTMPSNVQIDNDW